MIDGIVKFETISRQKKQISVYPLSMYHPGGLKVEVEVAAAAD